MRRSAVDKILPYADSQCVAIDLEAHIANKGSVLIQAIPSAAEQHFKRQVEDYLSDQLQLSKTAGKTDLTLYLAFCNMLKAFEYMLDHSATILRTMLESRRMQIVRLSFRQSRFHDPGSLSISRQNNAEHVRELAAMDRSYGDYEYVDHEMLGLTVARSAAELERELLDMDAMLEFGRYLDNSAQTPEYQTAALLWDWVSKNGYGTITVCGSSEQVMERIEQEWNLRFRKHAGNVVFHADRAIKL